MSDLVGNPEDRFSQNEAHFFCGCVNSLEVFLCQENRNKAKRTKVSLLTTMTFYEGGVNVLVFVVNCFHFCEIKLFCTGAAI